MLRSGLFGARPSCGIGASARDDKRALHQRQELAHALQFLRQRLLESSSLRCAAADISEVGDQFLIFDPDVAPPDDVVLPEQGKRVVAELSFRWRCVGLEAVRPLPKKLEPITIPDDGIERCEQSNLV